jgi:phage gpG-like protein
MFRFRLDIAGEIQMDRGIARFSGGVSDYRPIWPVMADVFYAMERRQFQTEGEEGGKPWPQLSEPYARWKQVHYPGRPILQRTGDLMRSLTSQHDPNAVYNPQPRTLTLGTRLPYAIYHQSPQPRRVLPRRPEIQFSEPWKREMTKQMQLYLVQIATQSGFRRGLLPTDVPRYAKFAKPQGFPRRTQ